MKVRESGMPEEAYWESLFDVPLILDRLGIDARLRDVVEFGCGYGTFTIPVARRISGTLRTFDIDQAMVGERLDRSPARLWLRVWSQTFGQRNDPEDQSLRFGVERDRIDGEHGNLPFGDAVVVGPHCQALNDGADMGRAGLRCDPYGRRARSCFQ